MGARDGGSGGMMSMDESQIGWWLQLPSALQIHSHRQPALADSGAASATRMRTAWSVVRSQNSIGWSRMAPRGVIAIQRPQWGLCGRCLCRRDQCEARSTACPLRAQTGTQLRLGAAPCGFLAGILRFFGIFGNVANVDVAGSNPVSCSRFRRPGHDLRGRGDALSGHVAPWTSRGRRRQPIAAVSRGCADSPS